MSSSSLPSFFRSLRFRLTLSYASVFALCLVLVFLLLSLLMQRAALRHVDAGLVSEARRLLELAARRKTRIIQSEIDRYTRYYGADTVSVSLSAPSGEVIASSDLASWPPPPHQPKKEPPPGIPAFYGVHVHEGRRVRSVRMIGTDGHAIIVRRFIDSFDRDLHFAGWVLLASFASSLLIGTVITFQLTRRAVVRIDLVRQAALAIAKGDLSRRVPLTSSADEVAALTDAFNQMIEKIESALDELRMVTDSMAHDFRTPLTRMRGAAEMALLSGSPSSERTDVLSLVIEECDRLEGMSRNMLQIVRLDAGVFTPAKDPQNMPQLVREAVDLLVPAFEDKGITVDVPPMEETLRVAGDRPLLERILANLLDNALKFTPEGGRVTVAASRCRDGVHLTVSDTGVGIAAGDLPRIFDRFFRSDSSRSTEGSGLGLSFVQSAVRAHGGSVHVASRLGHGSTFTVLLPLAPTA